MHYISYGSLLLLPVTGTLSLHRFDIFLPLKWLVTLIVLTGDYSCSIYLFHVFIRKMVMEKNEALSRLTYAFRVYFSLSVIAAVVLSRNIEFPMLKVRDRNFPVRGKSSA